MIDRTKAPELSPLAWPVIQETEIIKLSNGVKINILRDATHAAFRFDVVLPYGVWNQPQPLIASTTLNMLGEGTRRHTSEELAEQLDFYGAYSDFTCGMHVSEASLFSLTKHSHVTIEQMGEMLLEPVFPATELETYLRNKRQAFLVNCQKTGWLSQKEMARVYWGDGHPYANVLKESDYDVVTANMLHNYYRQNLLHPSDVQVFLTGNITDKVLKSVEQTMGQFVISNEKHEDLPFVHTPNPMKRHHIHKDGAVQASIRIAKQGVSLLSEEYPDFMLLNMLLGGYFGSRLMSKLREEKGYTYGIQSCNLDCPKGAIWFVGTDVKADVCDEAVDAIMQEINRLRNEKVSDGELSLVKNYMYGDLLRELDGVYAQNDALKHKMLYGLDNSFYIKAIEKIKRTTSEDLLALAQKYLKTEEMYIITVGK